jgi:hypothetical protein
MKTKIAIGCIVQWYEIEIVGEYIESLKQALTDNDEVMVDFTFNINQQLEKIDDTIEIEQIVNKFTDMMDDLDKVCNNGVSFRINEDFITIADYRRWFNDEYCEVVDVLMWGETDALIPKQTFEILDMLHQQVKDTTPKYLSTFAINKMWDDSWKPIEHVDFTDKPFIENDTENWWSIPYTMNLNEMNKFNNKVDDLDIVTINPHKFNGCGLVISSEVVKAGVNIPKCSFFINEDTSFMLMTQKVLGNIPQYHFRNILIVHNRKHSEKRKYILGEGVEDYIDNQRKLNSWYNKANEFCKINNQNLFNPNFKFYTWNDVWRDIK